MNRTYWENYKSQCYVNPEVATVLKCLAEDYKLAVVSNFKVLNGIEALLEINGIRQYFEFVVTSVREGWRKPHPKIYQAALELAGCDAGEVLFIGDDYENDYVMPKKLGMKAILLSKGTCGSEGVMSAGFETLVEKIDMLECLK